MSRGIQGLGTKKARSQTRFRVTSFKKLRTFLGTINFSPSAETNVTVSSDVDDEAEDILWI
jgi:hypothetical protein